MPQSPDVHSVNRVLISLSRRIRVAPACQPRNARPKRLGDDGAFCHGVKPCRWKQMGAHGTSHPSWITDQYLVRAAYRKRVHRDWMFLEIEPGLDFFREDGFSMTPLINVKLEIVFGAFRRL